MVITDRDTRILNVYQIFRRVISKYGKNFSLPEHTDPKKTYSWRYLSHFVDKLDALDIDDRYVSVVIEAILQHAKTKGLLNRGVAVLLKQDILELCLKKLEKDQQVDNNRLMTIKKSHDFLLKQLRQEGDPIRILSSKRNQGAYANMTCWFEQGLLSVEYIAVSKQCRRTFRYLQPSELELYPEPRELLKLKLKILSMDTASELKQVLGDDLFEE